MNKDLLARLKALESRYKTISDHEPIALLASIIEAAEAVISGSRAINDYPEQDHQRINDFIQIIDELNSEI
jgi:tryptophan synthase alpha subunit